MRVRRRTPAIEWPGGKRFAFSIFDDTDLMTMERGRPVYDAFDRAGMRITKSVWPVAAAGPQLVGGSTCADPDYLDWVVSLQAAGHEIGFHNASDHSSTRSETIEALDRFEQMFGHAPRVGADHAGNREALYWGTKRVSGLWAPAYAAAQKVMRPDRPPFSGEEPTSEFFWGDVCRDRIDYWRNFCFDEVDLTRVSPVMPYHDPRRPYVNYWYSSTDASNPDRFFRCLGADRLDALERNGGVCIMYTHLGHGMAPDGQLDPRFEPALEELTGRSVWIAPVSQVLDHLREVGRSGVITGGQRARLEAAWILDRARHSSFLRGRQREV